MMSGQEKLAIVAIIVAIFVIIGLAIIFSCLFFLYSFYKVRHINFGFEDNSLIKEVKANTLKINLRKQKNNKGPYLTIKEALKEEEKVDKRLHVILGIFSSIIIAILIVIFSIGLCYRINNDNLFIGNTTYMVIMTSSMEEKNEKNEYLEEFDLNNQINQYALIGISKIDSEEDIKLYDIVAYKYQDMVIVHRVIEINKDEDANKTFYVLRGDSNASSLVYEQNLEFKDIVGKYNGYQSYGCGVALTYIKSEIGFIALIGAALFLLLATFAECNIDKAYKKRITYLEDNQEILLDTYEYRLINNSTDEYFATFVGGSTIYSLENSENNDINNDDNTNNIVIGNEKGDNHE